MWNPKCLLIIKWLHKYNLIIMPNTVEAAAQMWIYPEI